MQKEYLSAAAEVLSDQGVDEHLGLSTGEASSRLAKTGPNKLEEAEKTPLWKRFFEQMADPMVIMPTLPPSSVHSRAWSRASPTLPTSSSSCSSLSSTRCWAWSRKPRVRRPLEALQEMSAAQSKVLRDGKLVHLPS